MPSTAPAARPVPDESALRQRLAALRRRIRRTAIVRGVSWLVFTTAFLAVAAGYRRRSGPAAEPGAGGLLVAWLVGVGLLAWHFLSGRCRSAATTCRWPCASSSASPPSTTPSPAPCSSSTTPAGAAGDSASLRREAVKRALGKAKGCDFNRVVDARGLRTAAALAPLHRRRRPGPDAVLPRRRLQRPGPPASTRSTTATCRRGRCWTWRRRATASAATRPYEIRGRVRGVVPDHASVVVRIDGFPAERIRHRRRAEGDGTGDAGPAPGAGQGAAQLPFPGARQTTP